MGTFELALLKSFSIRICDYWLNSQAKGWWGRAGDSGLVKLGFRDCNV